MRTVLHLDMDAFYASVEQRDRPELRGKPVIIGADPKGGRGRGVVSTASYEARVFGVGSAMPISTAWNLCPQGVFVPPNMARYSEVSAQVMAILRRYTDLVEQVSVDEAFLDVTGSRRIFGDGEVIAAALKRDIVHDLQITASVGLATSKLVAKIASDMRKPDGLVVVPPGTEAAFLAVLPVRRLWGVGPKMEESLARLGIVTIGALAAADPGRLAHRMGTNGHDLQRLARGEDERAVVADSGDAKSVGHEHTYDVDTADVSVLRRTLLGLGDNVARRLRHHGLRGRTVTLKYRDQHFHTYTRALTLDTATDAGSVLFEAAWKLFEKIHREMGGKVRLIGVTASKFEEEQRALFAPETSKADRVRDAIEERFGKGALTRGSLVDTRPLDRKGTRRVLK